LRLIALKGLEKDPVAARIDNIAPRFGTGAIKKAAGKGFVRFDYPTRRGWIVLRRDGSLVQSSIKQNIRVGYGCSETEDYHHALQLE
jgi:hypothetical protein